MTKYQLTIICFALTTFSCLKENKSGKQVKETNAPILDNVVLEIRDTSDTEIFQDKSYFKVTKEAYIYNNITYYFDDLSYSPYFDKGLLVKKVKTITSYRTADLTQVLTRLEIISDLDKSLIPDIVIEKPSDDITLYSHHYECSYAPQGMGDWSRIELFNYKNDSKPFATSDEFYWLFNMSSSSKFTAKTNFYLTITKDFDNKFLFLNLCDNGGVIQSVKVLNKSNNEIGFWYPTMNLVSENPYQYKYTADQSKLCETISISTKDTTDVRRHITKTSISLRYVTTDSKSDSVLVTIDDGYFFGKKDKLQEIEIFKN